MKIKDVFMDYWWFLVIVLIVAGAFVIINWKAEIEQPTLEWQEIEFDIIVDPYAKWCRSENCCVIENGQRKGCSLEPTDDCENITYRTPTLTAVYCDSDPDTCNERYGIEGFQCVDELYLECTELEKIRECLTPKMLPLICDRFDGCTRSAIFVNGSCSDAIEIYGGVCK